MRVKDPEKATKKMVRREWMSQNIIGILSLVVAVIALVIALLK